MDMPEVGRAIGTALVVAVIGPLFWLGTEWVSNSFESLVRKAVRRWGSKEPGAQERLLQRLATFRVIRK
jgi:hypothetical protein